MKEELNSALSVMQLVGYYNNCVITFRKATLINTEVVMHGQIKQ